MAAAVCLNKSAAYPLEDIESSRIDRLVMRSDEFTLAADRSWGTVLPTVILPENVIFSTLSGVVAMSYFTVSENLSFEVSVVGNWRHLFFLQVL